MMVLYSKESGLSMYTTAKNFFVQGVDKWRSRVYDALVKAKASLSYYGSKTPFLFFVEKERLLWVLFPIILAVWCLTTGS